MRSTGPAGSRQAPTHAEAGAGRSPGTAADERIVLFDGVCRLCAAWARFLARFDRDRRFRLARIQSEAGRRILAGAGLPTDRFDTLVLAGPDGVRIRSDAVLAVLEDLPFPWPPLAALGRLLPAGFRDRLYDAVARSRYRVFGRAESCPLPTTDDAGRYLPDG